MPFSPRPGGEFDEDLWSEYRAGVGVRVPGGQWATPAAGLPSDPFVCELVSTGDYRLRRGGADIPVIWGALRQMLLDADLTLSPGERTVVPTHLALAMVEQALAHVRDERRRLENDVLYIGLMKADDGDGPLQPMIAARSAIQSAGNRLRTREQLLRRALESAAGGRQPLKSAA